MTCRIIGYYQVPNMPRTQEYDFVTLPYTTVAVVQGCGESPESKIDIPVGLHRKPEKENI